MVEVDILLILILKYLRGKLSVNEISIAPEAREDRPIRAPSPAWRSHKACHLLSLS